MKCSESIAQLAKALSIAQYEMEGAKKASVNPHLKTKYADISSVWEAARKPLFDNGLSVVQTTLPSQDGAHVETTLLHASGEYVSGELFIPAQKKDAHGFGSALTYARRYALMAMLGIAPEDDDGSAAVQPAKEQKEQPKKQYADVSPLYDQLKSCKDLQDLARVSIAIGKQKENLSPDDLKKLQDQYLNMKSLLEEK